jgi:transposase InsO family protein
MSEAFLSVLKSHGIRISMDGRGRALDNVFVERLWRTVKHGHVYLHPALGTGRSSRRISGRISIGTIGSGRIRPWGAKPRMWFMLTVFNGR